MDQVTRQSIFEIHYQQLQRKSHVRYYEYLISYCITDICKPSTWTDKEI